MSTRLVQAQPESNFGVSINKLVATSTLHDKLHNSCLKDFDCSELKLMDWTSMRRKVIIIDLKKILELRLTSG